MDFRIMSTSDINLLNAGVGDLVGTIRAFKEKWLITNTGNAIRSGFEERFEERIAKPFGDVCVLYPSKKNIKVYSSLVNAGLHCYVSKKYIHILDWGRK